LTALKGRKIGASLSLPLGPLAVGTEDLKKAKGAIDDELGAASKLFKKTGPTFYAVGGAWRAFAHLALAVDEDYPLRLLHQFTLTARQVDQVAAFAMSQSETSLASVPDISGRRAAGLPYAALLLTRLMKKGGFEKVMISANGLREGVVCAADPSLVSDGDPLISGAEALARSVAPEPDFGRALEPWIEPAFAEEPPVFSMARDRTLRAAAARLADVGARMHPDHRAELTATQILYAPIGGLTHAERAFLALTLHHRYAGKRLREEGCASRRLLDDDGEAAALKLGMALRLGAALSGRSASVLGAFSLKRTKSALALSVEAGAEALVVERAQQRFEQLANIFGLDPKVV
jgi:exopolyphosphatase/guanosine-5'-triphosphate,3'-diphosphate pyrophosphatase